MAFGNGILAALKRIVDTPFQDGLVGFKDLIVTGDHRGFAAQARAMDVSYEDTARGSSLDFL